MLIKQVKWNIRKIVKKKKKIGAKNPLRKFPYPICCYSAHFTYINVRFVYMETKTNLKRTR